MQLKLKRSQRTGGMMGGKLFFILDARVHLSAEEESLVQKYKLGKQSIYDSENRKKHLDVAGAHFDASQSGGGAGSGLAQFGKGLLSAAMAGLALKVTIESLSAGQHIECKDLDELLGAEAAIREACTNVKAYLDTAQMFDGREEVVEF